MKAGVDCNAERITITGLDAMPGKQHPAPLPSNHDLDASLGWMLTHTRTLEDLYDNVQHLGLATLVADDTGAYVMANHGAFLLTGYTPEELRRMSVWDLIPPAGDVDAQALWRSFLRILHQTGTITLRTKSGAFVTARYAARAHVIAGLHLSLLAALA